MYSSWIYTQLLSPKSKTSTMHGCNVALTTVTVYRTG